MLAYYDEDLDFTICQTFYELWAKTFPELRADMGRILMDITMDNKYNSLSIYSFDLHNQNHASWQLSFDMIEQIAKANCVSMQKIIDTMPLHLFIETGRMMWINTTIGTVSTAKAILKKFGFSPEIIVNEYGVKYIK